MTALAARGLGKRYGRRWALQDCTLEVPKGHVVGLVGANGAGKTTLLQLAVGMVEPSAGTLEVLGEPVSNSAEQLARIGYLAQDAPVYASLTVGEHLRLGQQLNPGWDADVASARLAALGLDLGQRAGRLSGGQRSQLALTLAMGKRPELLLLDEPVASLDPLARREFLQDLMALVAEDEPAVLLSSHLLADVERVCDYLIVLARGEVRLAGPVDTLLAEHKVLTGVRQEQWSVPQDQEVVQVQHTGRQITMLVRVGGPVLDPRWAVSDVGLEELVLAYMAPRSAGSLPAGGRLLSTVQP